MKLVPNVLPIIFAIVTNYIETFFLAKN